MKRVLVSALAAILVASCGIQGTAEDTLKEVRKTNESTDKMVDTTGRVVDLNQKLLDQTTQLNQQTAKLLQAMEGMMKLTQGLNDQTTELNKETGKLLQAMAGMTKLMRVLNDKMDSTKNDVTLLGGSMSIASDVNTEGLTPPLLMLPAAKKMAEAAAPGELIELYYVYTTFAKVGGLDNNVKPRDRLRAYRIASAIVAMASDEKIAQVFQEQVEHPGLYEGTTYELAASRYNFIRQYLFNRLFDHERTTVVNEDVLKEAVSRFESMKALAESRYVGNFTVTIPGVRPDPDVDDQHPNWLDSTETVSLADLKKASEDILADFTVGDPNHKPQPIPPRLSSALLQKDSVQQLLKRLSL